MRIDDTIYAQYYGKLNKLFTFDLNTKKWEMCDGMDIGDGDNVRKYVGAKYGFRYILDEYKKTDQIAVVIPAID